MNQYNHYNSNFKHLLKPRVKIDDLMEMHEQKRNWVFSMVAQRLGLSSPTEVLNMDISQLEDEKLMILLKINLNITRMASKYMDLYPHLVIFVGGEPFKPSIPLREQDIIILRTGWLCESYYECIHHIRSGLVYGLSAEEIVRIFKGSNESDWSTFESALLHAVDEIYNNQFIDGDIWEILSEHYDEHQILELILTIGHYIKLAIFLNSTGIKIESQHSGYGEISERINNDPRAKAFYKLTNDIEMIYRDKILEGKFDYAEEMLRKLVKKEEFKIVKKLFGDY